MWVGAIGRHLLGQDPQWFALASPLAFRRGEQVIIGTLRLSTKWSTPIWEIMGNRPNWSGRGKAKIRLTAISVRGYARAPGSPERIDMEPGGSPFPNGSTFFTFPSSPLNGLRRLADRLDHYLPVARTVSPHCGGQCFVHEWSIIIFWNTVSVDGSPFSILTSGWIRSKKRFSWRRRRMEWASLSRTPWHERLAMRILVELGER
jgi:hypothetical protein